MAARWRVLLILLTIAYLLTNVTAQCDVRVPAESPWPETLYAPHNASIYINCTLGQDTPFWAISLADFNTDLQFFVPSQRQKLNNRGLYELPQIETLGMPPILRLLINNTSVNNNTVIKCSSLNDGIHQTTLYLYEVILHAEDLDEEQSLNISWIDPYESNWLYNLTVINSAYKRWMFTSQTPHHIFTAPNGALACEVYHFSVTASYSNATYTGAGCSVLSPVLSRMLPSLPNISQLESSLEYVLEKQSTGFAVEVSFEPASHCKNYLIVNYTLEVNSSLDQKILGSVLEFNAGYFILGASLPNENALYSFRVVVANDVGIVGTSDRRFYTTDVQTVTATLIEGVDALTIQCEFVTGSNATGCMAVLTGFEAYHVNLTKHPNANSTNLTISLEHPGSCYTGVEAFDIEADSSVGSLAVPGQLIIKLGTESETPCTPTQTSTFEPRATEQMSSTLIVVIVATVVTVVVIVVIVFAITSMIYKCKRSQSMDEKTSYKIENPLSDYAKDAPNTTAVQKMDIILCTDTSAKCNKSEVSTAKEESFYSEIPSAIHLREQASSGGIKSEAESVSITATLESEYKGLEGEQGNPWVPQDVLYDQPVAVKARTPGDGANENKRKKGLSTTNCEENEGHTYFTLEPGGVSHGITASPSIDSDAQKTPQPGGNVSALPIYHEINDIAATSRRKAAAKSVNNNGEITPSSPLPNSNPS